MYVRISISPKALYATIVVALVLTPFAWWVGMPFDQAVRLGTGPIGLLMNWWAIKIIWAMAQVD